MAGKRNEATLWLKQTKEDCKYKCLSLQKYKGTQYAHIYGLKEAFLKLKIPALKS